MNIEHIELRFVRVPSWTTSCPYEFEYTIFFMSIFHIEFLHKKSIEIAIFVTLESQQKW